MSIKTKGNTKKLCMSLLKADTEDEVIKLLTDAEYWNDETVWRLYGDKEGNWATAGSQQSEPEAALVEKLINSVDASLVGKCLLEGIDPESEEAPASIRQAVAYFYEGKHKNTATGGMIKEWSNFHRREVANTITLAATGTKKTTCLTIVDQGEGQTPNRIPDTILSLNKKNKQRIRFVQGKFNMGGTGVLRHCHNHSLQLVISKRNPNIVEKQQETDKSLNEWGFTIVRRVRPTGDAGTVIHSEFKYLAPLKLSDKGEVLRFKSDSLPIMPLSNEAYSREIKWGTAIKLFNYDLSAGSSNVIRPDGLLYKLEALLPQIALPVRIHECRKHFGAGKSGKGSFDTNIAGLTVRIEKGKGNNLEVDPWDVPFCVHELNFKARIYVFKKGKAATYLKNQGIVFSINGQTHGTIKRAIFGRKKVGLNRIGKDLFVLVDCSEISVDAREDLFMSSRDRLSEGELRRAIEKQLEEILANDSELKNLQEERRSKEQSEKLSNEKPLEEVLNNILKSSPTLSSLFLKGQRLNMPKNKGQNQYQQNGGGKENLDGNGSNEGSNAFIGRKHPTYIRFQKAPNSELYERNCEQGRMVRITLETDAENGYFTRADNAGRYQLDILSGKLGSKEISHSADLHNGLIQWSISLPNDVVIGEELEFLLSVNDAVLLAPLERRLKVKVKPKSAQKPGPRKDQERRGDGKGSSKSLTPTGMKLPKYIKVKEGDNNWNEHDFDINSGCCLMRDLVDDEYEATFYINVDNINLQNEIKNSKAPSLDEAKYIYGNVLIGLSLIYDYEKNDDDDEDILQSDTIKVSRALSPFLIPMINYLGGLSENDADHLAALGDE